MTHENGQIVIAPEPEIRFKIGEREIVDDAYKMIDTVEAFEKESKKKYGDDEPPERWDIFSRIFSSKYKICPQLPRFMAKQVYSHICEVVVESEGKLKKNLGLPAESPIGTASTDGP